MAQNEDSTHKKSLLKSGYDAFQKFFQFFIGLFVKAFNWLRLAFGGQTSKPASQPVISSPPKEEIQEETAAQIRAKASRERTDRILAESKERSRVFKEARARRQAEDAEREERFQADLEALKSNGNKKRSKIKKEEIKCLQIR